MIAGSRADSIRYSERLAEAGIEPSVGSATEAGRAGDWRAAGRYRAWANNRVRLAALHFVLFHTGRRVLSLLQSEVDLDGELISVPRSKQSRPEVLCLPPDAAALLRRVPQLAGKPFGYSATSAVLKAVKKVCARNNLEPLTTHESGRRAALNDTRNNHPEIESEQANRAMGWAAGSQIPDRIYRDVNTDAVNRVVMRKFKQSN